MSTLESLLVQLKKQLAEKQAENPTRVSSEPKQDNAVDPKVASAALKEFLNKASTPRQTSNGLPDEDPMLVASRRKALSTFIGTPISGVFQNTPLSATVSSASPAAAAPSSGHGASSHGSSPHASGNGTVAALASAAATATAPAPAVTPPQPAAAVAPSAPPATPCKCRTPFAWSKHINTIEGALQMGDFHFAESLISLLNDTAAAVTIDPSAQARLKSQQARVRIERKQFTEAESDLAAAIRSLEGTAYKRSIGAAYCLHALAQCYQRQNKLEQAQAAQRNAISIAEECLGPMDPEAKLFKQKLA